MTKKYHFIYRTISLITNHYYLGVHSTNDLNDGYIGSGIKFLNYVKKYGYKNFSREILKHCLTRDEAFRYEATLLTEAILNDDLCLNLVSGGRGYNHIYNETFKHRISKTRKIRILEGRIIPTKHSEEWKQHLRENNPGGKATAKLIYQIDMMGNVIKRWESSRKAGIELNIKSWRNISHCASKQYSRTVGGYYWRWADSPDVINNQLKNIVELNKNRTDRSLKAGKQILQLDANTQKIINTWKNQCEAARQLNIDNAELY